MYNRIHINRGEWFSPISQFSTNCHDIITSTIGHSRRAYPENYIEKYFIV